MKVPLLDLKAQYATIRREILQAASDVLDSQLFTIGPFVKELEKTVAGYSGCAAAVGVSSGTDAILASLMALGIGPGDEVITTPFTFFATAGCVWRAGARPVFVDIEADTFNIDPARIEPAITAKTKAIIPVHLYGQMAEMDELTAVAFRGGLHVIEDAAQAVGATYNGRKAGSIGTTGCLSFYPTKNLGGIGDGGMILTQDKALASRLEVFREHGQSPTYFYKWIGGNFRLDNIQAAALLVKMRYLDQWTARRQANAALYDRLLAGCPGVTTPAARKHNGHVYHQYVIRVAGTGASGAPRRNDLQAFLKAGDIASAVFYPLCLHEQECFKALGYKKGDFPVAERAAAEVLALPIYPELTDDQIAFVARKIREFMKA
jgi:dTDP-4-amino-4,6-dideoxygalactose transaminase